MVIILTVLFPLVPLFCEDRALKYEDPALALAEGNLHTLQCLPEECSKDHLCCIETLSVCLALRAEDCAKHDSD